MAISSIRKSIRCLLSPRRLHKLRKEGGEESALVQGAEGDGGRIRGREVTKDGGGLEAGVTVVSAGVQDDSGLPGPLHRGVIGIEKC